MERVLCVSSKLLAVPSPCHTFKNRISNSGTTRCYYPYPPSSPTTAPRTNSLSSSFNPLPPRFSFSPPPPLPESRCTATKKSKGKVGGRGPTVVCYAGPLLTSPTNLRWICAISSLVLMLSRGTAINKSFLVPLFALQAPSTVISWIKGEYGIWTAFLALLVRLFFFLPGELELPLMALLLVIVAPYQVMDLRAKQAGAIVGLAIVGYVAFQHFSRTGNFKQAFEQGPLVATLAIICLTVISIVFLI